MFLPYTAAMYDDSTLIKGSYDLSSQAAEQQLKLASVWHLKQRFSQAIASYQKAIQFQPSYIPAYLDLGHLLAQTGQTDRAIEVYQQALALNATEPWLPGVIADLQTKYRDFTQQEQEIQQSIAQYQAALQQKPAHRSRRILLYTNCPGTYGAEQASHALMCRLTQSGYQVICVQSPANHHLIQTREALGIQHIWLQGNAHYTWYSLSNVAEVAEILTQTLPDLVLFADGGPTANLAANWVAMKLGVPYLRIIHCVDPVWAEQFATYLSALPAIYEAAEAVITVSQSNLKLLSQQFQLPVQMGQVIYYGRPDEYFKPQHSETRHRLRQALGIPQDAVMIFTAARFEPVKGFQHQISAIAQLRQTPVWSQLFFVWAGTGSLETHLQTKLTELGVGEQVKLLGERSDIPDLLDAADIFLLPSHAEGMPLAVMEAMAKGLPVMATAISGIPEELGDTGQLLPDPTLNPHATVEAIVKTIQVWATNAQLRQEVAHACQQRAAQMFREEFMLEAYLKLIHSLIGSRDVINFPSYIP